MPPRQRLSIVDRGRALAWIQTGTSIREVARRLSVHHSVIQRLYQRFHATGSVQERPHPGRPRCTTRREDRFLQVSALRDRTTTADQLRRQLLRATNNNISDQTVRNRLHEARLHSRNAAVRIPLTPAHRQARVVWCRRHLRWTRQQWSQVLFTDESRFTLSFNDGRIHVWRRQGERFHDCAVREHDRYGGGSVMVWGGIHLNGRTPLHLVQGTLTGARYRDDILRPIVMPTLRAMGRGSILQDDNAPPHRAMVARAFLQQQNIPRMDWPARSPDLAPIEHLWDSLGRSVRDNHPPAANLAQLSNYLQQEWQNISQATIRTLINSMRQRCVETLAANGGHTRY